MTQGLFSATRVVLCALFLFLNIVSIKSAVAQEAETVNSLANDMDQIDIYLHTINVGNMIYDNFGHTAIRVVDHRKYSDMVYNWGTFSFDDGPLTFAWNFYKGHLTYTLSIYPYTAAMRIYKHDNRTVWEDKLVLTATQKETLLKRLEWNAKPENRGYSYQYFFDNCSTRPRNYIDEALGGVLMGNYSEAISNKTFRDFVMDGYQTNPGMDVLLDFGMNSNIDRFATVWETMFHPLHLRAVLLEYSKTHAPLLTDGHTLVEHPQPDAYPKLAYSFMLLFGGVPLIPLVFGLFFQQKKEEPSRLLYRGFGALASLWLGFGAFWGFMMALSWAVSDHLDLHHNANQLLFWPIDVFAFILAFLIFIKARPLKLKPFAWNFARAYLLLHIVVSILMPCLRAFGVITQDVNRVSVFLLPPYVAILLMIFRVGIRRDQSRSRIEV